VLLGFQKLQFDHAGDMKFALNLEVVCKDGWEGMRATFSTFRLNLLQIRSTGPSSGTRGSACRCRAAKTHGGIFASTRATRGQSQRSLTFWRASLLRRCGDNSRQRLDRPVARPTTQIRGGVERKD
jgi:hypothetical protein